MFLAARLRLSSVFPEQSEDVVQPADCMKVDGLGAVVLADGVQRICEQHSSAGIFPMLRSYRAALVSGGAIAKSTSRFSASASRHLQNHLVNERQDGAQMPHTGEQRLLLQGLGGAQAIHQVGLIVHAQTDGSRAAAACDKSRSRPASRNENASSRGVRRRKTIIFMVEQLHPLFLLRVEGVAEVSAQCRWVGFGLGQPDSGT